MGTNSGSNLDMVTEITWPVLQSCKHQSYEARDRLSQLPDDLLICIMSSFTTKEVVRTSVLSHRWKYLWRCFPVLIFEDVSAMKRMERRVVSFQGESVNSPDKLRFCKWVLRVTEAHLGRYVDEFRVSFDLNKRHQSFINKWVDFAIAGQVRKLELNFSPCVRSMYKPSIPKWDMSHSNHISILKSCLHSLSLQYVSVTTKDVDCLLRSCTVLEDLSIGFTPSLKYIRAFDLPLPLKHLHIEMCSRLRSIDIFSPKLLSFVYYGNPIELHIRNASLLSKLSLGLIYYIDVVSFALDYFSKYFPQFEYLSFWMPLSKGSPLIGGEYVQYNLGIKNLPPMTNLKHLELHVQALSNESLLGWVDLIEASPLLERLTITVNTKYQSLFDEEFWLKNKALMEYFPCIVVCAI